MNVLRTRRYVPLLLAGCLALSSGWPTQTAWAEASVDTLKKQARTGSREERITALKALVKKGNVALIPLRVSILNGDYKVREEAAKMIATFGKEAVAHLKYILKNGKNAAVIEALEAIAKIGKDAKELEPLLFAFVKAYNSRIHEYVLKAYASLGAVTLKSLVKGVKTGKTKIVVPCFQALRALGKTAAPALRELIQHNPANIPTVQDAACILATLGPKHATFAMPHLLKILKGDRRGMYIDVFKALGKTGVAGKQAVPAIVAFLEDKSKGKHFKKYGLKALRGIGIHAVEAIPTLTTFVRMKDMRYAFAAAFAMSTMKEKGLRALVTLLRAKEKRTVKVALRAIGKMGKEATPALKSIYPILLDKDLYVRAYAVEALGSIGEAASYPYVLKVAQEEKDKMILRDAIRALSKLKPTDAKTLKVLEKSCWHDSWYVRRLAVRLLAKDDKKGLAILIKLLKQDNFKEKIAALKVIAKMGKKAKAALPLLKKMKKTTSGKLHNAVLSAYFDVK